MNTQTTQPSYDDLLACIKALRPFAASRAEDMHESGGDECPHWAKADLAVQTADALLSQVQQVAPNSCDDCGTAVDSIVGCPDGSEVCEGCSINH